MAPDVGQVSVVIPCFNAERTIAESIDSVLDQSQPACEIIVVDDGSSDQSVAVVSRYGDHVKLERSSHGGASHARNLGTQVAKGDYIQYLDADDLLSRHALEWKVAALKDSHFDVAYTDWHKFRKNEDGQNEYLERNELDISEVHKDPEIACATEFWAPPAALLYKRGIVEKIGGWNQSLPVIQDARFLFDAARHGAKFIRIPGIGAYYRTAVAGSLSNKSQQEFVADVLRNAEQIEALWRGVDDISTPRKAALASIYDYVAREMFRVDEESFQTALSKIDALRAGGKSKYVMLAGLLYKIMGIRNAREVMKLVIAARNHNKR